MNGDIYLMPVTDDGTITLVNLETGPSIFQPTAETGGGGVVDSEHKKHFESYYEDEEILIILHAFVHLR